MALQKNPINITFNQGVQTKIDPYQLPIGAFSSLTNAVFNKDGLLQKRNGYELLFAAPTGATTLCTLNGGLVTLGQTCQSYSEDNATLTNAGVFQPMAIQTRPSVRYQDSVWTCDTALSPNGLACTVFMNANNSTAYYQISDSDTGQVLVPITLLGTVGIWPRVEVLDNYFVILYLDTVSATTHLQYILIPFNKPTSPSSPTMISNKAKSLNSPFFDSTVNSGNLYLALYCNDIGGAVRVWNITRTELIQAAIPTPATMTAAAFSAAAIPSISVDPNNGFPLIWVALWADSVEVFALNNNLTTNLGVTSVIASGLSANQLAIVADNQIVEIYYALQNIITTTASIESDLITKRTVNLAGTVSAASTVTRGLSLASKPIRSTTLNKTVMLAAYGNNFGFNTFVQTNEPTNFLIDSDGNVLARLAQNNAYGYFQYPTLPKIQEMDKTLYVAYLYADLLNAVNKTQGSSLNGVAAQYGVNLAAFSFSEPTPALEIANSLHTSGGFLWQYDGAKIVEHGFHLYPENVYAIGSSSGGSIPATTLFYVATYEWTDGTGLIHKSAPSIPLQFIVLTPPAPFTATQAINNHTLTGVADTTHLQIGQHISGVGIPANTYITHTTSSTITMSANSTVTGSNTMTVTQLGSVSLQIPTLKQTYKTSNQVRIVVYRWSTLQQTYYQITNVISPLLNNTSADTVTFVDTHSDAQIIGNNQLYTAGGVLENIPAPGSIAMTLWQSRLFMVDAEDRNLIWFSKPVIEATPIEMTDVQTIYIAPTTGAQGSTGDITALFSMDDKLLVFKKDAIYYITGQGPDITGANNGFSDPVFITGTVGCDNPKSLVLTPQGVMFQSDKGIWMLGRDLQTTYLGAPVESYEQNHLVTSAVCVPGTNQVRFSLDNNTAVMYDYFYNRWSNWSNVNAVSSVIYEGVQAYLNAYGSVVMETPNKYRDLSRPVLLSLTTGWINLAGLQGFERFYQMLLLGTYYTPVKAQVLLAYDYNSSPIQSTIVPVLPGIGSNWGSESQWGTGGPWGGSESNQMKARVFPKKQKCEAFQVTINEVYDPTQNIAPGQGFTLSGLNLTVGAKKGSRTQSAKRSFG